MIKITKEQGGNNLPINAPIKLVAPNAFFKKGFEFPIVKLVNVHYSPDKKVKRNGADETTPALSFTFVDTKNTKKTFTHTEYPILATDDKYTQKLDAMLNRIKHIFDETLVSKGIVFNEEDATGDSFETFFANVDKMFNTHTVDVAADKKRHLYATTLLYLKLSYYKARVQLPSYPNFVQAVMLGDKQTECELIINPDYDKITPQSSNAQAPGMSGLDGNFGAATGFDNFDDLPQL